MQRVKYIAFAMSVILTCPSFAATIESVNGKVLINHGDGFLPTVSGAQANPGDLVMANAGGSAKLVYAGGCQVQVSPGRIVSVGKQPPCTAPSLAGLEAPPPAYVMNPLLPFGIVAAVGFGIYCATVWCQEHHHHHGKGPKPGSP